MGGLPGSRTTRLLPGPARRWHLLLCPARGRCRILVFVVPAAGGLLDSQTWVHLLPLYFWMPRRSRPVISAGWAWPSAPNMVGAVSRNEPLGCSDWLSLSLTRMKGGGFLG